MFPQFLHGDLYERSSQLLTARESCCNDPTNSSVFLVTNTLRKQTGVGSQALIICITQYMERYLVLPVGIEIGAVLNAVFLPLRDLVCIKARALPQ